MWDSVNFLKLDLRSVSFFCRPETHKVGKTKILGKQMYHGSRVFKKQEKWFIEPKNLILWCPCRGVRIFEQHFNQVANCCSLCVPWGFDSWDRKSRGLKSCKTLPIMGTVYVLRYIFCFLKVLHAVKKLRKWVYPNPALGFLGIVGEVFLRK